MDSQSRNVKYAKRRIFTSNKKFIDGNGTMNIDKKGRGI